MGDFHGFFMGLKCDSMGDERGRCPLVERFNYGTSSFLRCKSWKLNPESRSQWNHGKKNRILGESPTMAVL